MRALQTDRFSVQLEFARLDLRHVNRFSYHAAQMVGLLVHHGQELGLPQGSGVGRLLRTEDTAALIDVKGVFSSWATASRQGGFELLRLA